MGRAFWAGLALLLAASPAAAQDWPLLGHDVRRTNGTTAEIQPPFRRRWTRNFADEGLMYGIQPVVAGGRVYIGTMRGLLHAIDDATGQDVWTYPVPGGIFHAAAVAEGVVYVCGGDGKLHAVRDGKAVWIFDTGANVALWNAPLVFDGRVYFGGRDGFIYAVKDGAPAWKSEVGAPVVHSPAVDPDTKRLYIGAEDLCAYAFDATTGTRVWRSDRLPGFTFSGYHPVVLPAGGVVFTTRPFNRGWEGEADRTLDALLKKFYGTARNDRNEKDAREYPAFPNWRFTEELNRRLEAAVVEKYKEPGLWEKQFAFIREELVANPHRQTVFLLDGATGRPRGVPPVIYCESNNGTCQPPVVLPDGRAAIQVAAGLLHSRHKDVAWLDPKTGDLALVQPPDARHRNGTGLLIIPDEQAALSAAGPLLILSRQDEVHGFDTSGRRNVRDAWMANIHEPDKDDAAFLPLRILRGEPLPVGREYVRRGLGVYGGGSGVDSPSVVAGRTVYYIPQHEGNTGACLVAYETAGAKGPLKEPCRTGGMTDADRQAIAGSTWDFDYLMTRKADLGVAVPGTIGNPEKASVTATDAELEKILWEVPVVEPADHPLRKRLATAVEELLSKEWAPLAFPEGKYPGEGYWAFSDPSEIYGALGLAWPYLSDELRARAKLFQEDPVTTPSLDGRKGERRERYAFVTGQKFLDGRLRAPGLARLYPVWLYAHASGDWAWLEKNWPRLKGTLAAASGEWKQDGKNGLLSGLIAYGRIAAHLKDAEAVAAGTPKALAAMRERLEYEASYPRGGVYYYGASGTLRTGPARWTFLTPEIGRLCRTFAAPVQDALVSRYIDHHRPSWPLAWGILSCYGHENCTEMPIHAMSHFQAKAYLVETPAAELARAVDVPWCRADLYYIEKLALALRAASPLRWKDVRP